MFSILLLVTLSLAVLNGSQKEYHCCEEKIVNGITYLLVDNPDLKPDPICINDCIYQVENDPSTFFCFKHGMYEPECVDLNTTPPQIETTESNGNQFLVEDGVILVTGGDNSVEALNSNGTHLCNMPDLPDTRYVHSMSGDMLCGGWYTGDSCLQYKSGSWIEFPWKLSYGRAHHESWRSPSGEVILMGGWSGDGTNITENVTPLGSSEGFSLNEKSTSIRTSCSISFQDYVVISGGGQAPSKNVNVYNENGWVEELPSHIEARQYHGCGYYNNDDGDLVYLVVGGMENLASTEILVEGSDSWKYAGNLGLGRRSIRAITLNNELFTMGGHYKGYDLGDIFKFNRSTEQWEKIGDLSRGRAGYALTILPREDVEPYCVE